MSFSIGIYAIILIFTFIVIPGYIFRRFYFHGEFSKQINLSSNFILQVIYCSFIGVIISLLYVTILNLFKTEHVNIDGLLNSFDVNFLSENNPSQNKFDGLESKIYSTYLPFTALLYVSSALFGYVISKFVLFFEWDIKFSFLRFNNEWHYIFNGKILKFKKIIKFGQDQEIKVKNTFVDVLVRGDGETPSLYSGLLADYALCPINPNKIERLHIFKAQRYNKKEGKTEKINIPGNLFTILGDNIQNINCTYICYSDDEINNKKYNIKKFILFTSQILTFLVFVLISTIILLSFNLTENKFFQSIITSSLWYKFYVVFFINVFLGLFTPFSVNRKNKKVVFIGWKEFSVKIFLIVALGFILYFFY